MAKVIVKLNSNRDVVGKLELYNGAGLLVATYPAFGRADIGEAKRRGNTDASMLKPYGHTPTGKYLTNNAIITSGAGTRYNADSYGPNGILFLNPSSGNALTAKNNGRTGLAIHGGRAGVSNKLRPTNGCVRLSNGDMAALVGQVRFLFTQNDVIEYIQVQEGDIIPIILGDLSTKSNDPDPFLLS